MANVINSASEEIGDIDLNFLPADLTAQCRNLIESYHDIHGYACLPDMLWRARLGPFIERRHAFKQRLREGPTTPNAQKFKQGFVGIWTGDPSLGRFAGSVAGWNARCSVDCVSRPTS